MGSGLTEPTEESHAMRPGDHPFRLLPCVLPQNLLRKLEALADDEGSTPCEAMIRMLEGVPWTKGAILRAIQALGPELPGPTGSDLRGHDPSLLEAATASFGSWTRALEEAGLTPAEEPRSTLRALRIERALTIAEVSELVNVDATVLGKIEGGTAEPTPQLKQALLRTYAAFRPIELGWTFGVGLVRARTAKGWTRAALSEALGWSEELITRLEESAASGLEERAARRLAIYLLPEPEVRILQEYVGDRLRQRCNAMGWSTDELAARLACLPAIIRAFEDEVAYPAPAILAQLAARLGGTPRSDASADEAPLIDAKSYTGSRLYQLRRSRGLSQAQLAAAAGVSTSTISHYENEYREPTPQVQRRLREVLAPGAADSAAQPPRDDVVEIVRKSWETQESKARLSRIFDSLG